MLKKTLSIYQGAEDATMIQQANEIRSTYPDSAIVLFKKALGYYMKRFDNDGIAATLLKIGSCYYDKQDFRLSKFYTSKAASYCFSNSSKNKTLSTQYYHNLGKAYYRIGYMDSMTFCLFEALKEFKKHKLKDTALLMSIYYNIGSMAFMLEAYMEQSDQAFSYLNKARELAIEVKDSAFLAGIYMNLGRNYGLIDSTDMGMETLNGALNIFKQQNNLRGVRLVYFEIGRLLAFNKKEYKQALKYLDSAVAIDQYKFELNEGLEHGMGICYANLGEYAKAVFYYKQSIESCLEKGKIGDLPNIYGNLANAYRAMGNTQLAYESLMLRSKLKDSLIDQEKIRAANQMEVQYRTAEKDKEILQNQLLLKQKESKLQSKNFWIAGISISSLLLATLVFSFYRNNRHKQKLQTAQINDLEQRREIERLNSKMQGEENERGRIARELHDGVSVLLSAARMRYVTLGKEYRMLQEAHTYQEVMDLLHEAGQEVRSISYNLVPEVLLEKSLPAAIEAFCELMQKGHNIDIKVQIYGTAPVMQSDFSYAVYRIVQELIHNIIKHAQATEVQLQLLFHACYIDLTVEDNGIGFEEIDVQTGIGLKSLKTRIESLKGAFAFRSKPGMGTTVEVELPISDVLNK